MSPAEVPAELVEKAAEAAHAKIVNDWAVQPPWDEISEGLRDRTRAVIRHALAAVLPEVQAQALRDAASAEFQPTFGVSYSGLDAQERLLRRADRLTTTTEEPS